MSPQKVWGLRPRETGCASLGRYGSDVLEPYRYALLSFLKVLDPPSTGKLLSASCFSDGMTRCSFFLSPHGAADPPEGLINMAPSCLLLPTSLGPLQAFLGLPYGKSPTGLFSLMVNLHPTKGGNVTSLNVPIAASLSTSGFLVALTACFVT